MHRGGRGGHGGELEPEVPRGVGGHRHVAAGGSHDEHAPARQRPAAVKHLQRLAQRRQRLAARHTRLCAKGVEGRVRAGERTGMCAHRAAGGLGAPRLDERDRLAGRARPCRRVREACRVLDALEVQAERRHALVGAQQLQQILGRQARLVADADQVADRQ